MAMEGIRGMLTDVFEREEDLIAPFSILVIHVFESLLFPEPLLHALLQTLILQVLLVLDEVLYETDQARIAEVPGLYEPVYDAGEVPAIQYRIYFQDLSIERMPEVLRTTFNPSKRVSYY